MDVQLSPSGAPTRTQRPSINSKTSSRRSRGATEATFPAGPWPSEMRAPTAAAFFDFADTKELFAAVRRGDAPRPTAARGVQREPIWARSICEQFIAARHQVLDNVTAPSDEDIAALLA